MAGIYNIGHCVMLWYLSSREQGPNTCLFSIKTTPEMNLEEEIQREP